MTPKIHLTAFPDRAGHFIFVAVPDERGRYVRTDRSVALVGCRFCGAMVGEPCKGRQGDGYGGTTHFHRRHDARRFWGVPVDDVLSKAEATPDEWMEAAS